jgi:hypothetical protein
MKKMLKLSSELKANSYGFTRFSFKKLAMTYACLHHTKAKLLSYLELPLYETNQNFVY